MRCGRALVDAPRGTGECVEDGASGVSRGGAGRTWKMEKMPCSLPAEGLIGRGKAFEPIKGSGRGVIAAGGGETRDGREVEIGD